MNATAIKDWERKSPLPPLTTLRGGARGTLESCSVRINDGPQHDATLLGMIVARTAVHRRPLVPHQQIADAPRVIVGEAFLRGMRGEIFDQLPGLLVLHSLKAVGVHRVDE